VSAGGLARLANAGPTLSVRRSFEFESAPVRVGVPTVFARPSPLN